MPHALPFILISSPGYSELMARSKHLHFDPPLFISREAQVTHHPRIVSKDEYPLLQAFPAPTTNFSSRGIEESEHHATLEVILRPAVPRSNLIGADGQAKHIEPCLIVGDRLRVEREEELGPRKDGDEDGAGPGGPVEEWRHELTVWIISLGATRCEFGDRAAGADSLLALKFDVDVSNRRHCDMLGCGELRIGYWIEGGYWSICSQ
jgi:hypothetical protein